jgi:DNA invertase Pin-like site-specific DNA recombinase
VAETLHIYTRVSTVVQADEGMSLDVQRDIGIERAKSLGFEFKLWNEGGRSSNHEEIDKRPVLSQVYDGIRKGVIKHLFVYDQSRLSRNDNVSSIFRYECNKQGVTLYNKEGKYDLGNPQDQFLKQILDAVGQFDNAQRTERTRLGKIGRIRQGNWMGGPPPFGYEIKDKKLVIEPVEAKWVKRIFEMYADRISTMDIKIELDSNGVSPRRKIGTWSVGSLQALMRNTHYIGFWHYKDGKSGEVIKVDCLRILSTELWSRVKEVRDIHMARRGDNGVKHFYMLKRVLRCGHCGSWLSGIYSDQQSKNHYYCPKKERVWKKRPIDPDDKWERGRVCGMTRSLNIHDTDELVWNTVVDVLSRSKIVRNDVKVALLGDGVGNSLRYEVELNAAKAKLKKLKKYLSGLSDALIKVETERLLQQLSPEQYPVVKANITDEKIKIEAEVEQIENEIAGADRQKKWIDWVAKFQSKIDDYKKFSPEQKKEFLTGLVTVIDVYMIDSQTHWLDLEFKIPLVGDELVYVDPAKRSRGTMVVPGVNSLMIEHTSRPYAKKNE